MQLSPHFSLEELIASEVAARSGIDNTPPADVLMNLLLLAVGLEKVREILSNLPIHVTSGYRSKALNAKIHGSLISVHMQGLAADILCPQFGNPLAVCRAVNAAQLGTDQIIHEFGAWSHIAFPAKGMAPRNFLNTIRSVELGYELGLNPIETRLTHV
jgi:hypothetical protein